MVRVVDYKKPGGEMDKATAQDDALYGLEERVFSNVMDAVRQSGAPEEQRRQWQHEAMGLLVEAQDALAAGDFDVTAFTRRADAIEDSARSFSAI